MLADDARQLSVAFLQGNLAIFCQGWTGLSWRFSQRDHSCGSVIHKLQAFGIGKSVSGTIRLHLVGLGGEGRGRGREKRKKLLHVFRTAGFTLQRYCKQIFKNLGVLV